jgi:DNA-binding transcriptional regulator YdaS (Cro superfamily)
MDKAQGIHRAIRAAGGLTKLASTIGCTKQTVWMWANRRRVPVKHCPKIEAATGVQCEDLRPDVNWAYVRQHMQSLNERSANAQRTFNSGDGKR